MSAAPTGRPPLTLALDAATYTGSVALFEGRALVGEREAAMRGAEEERLMPAVAELLRDTGATPGDVGTMVCGGGPGSFTSLRIAAAIGKGIASAREIPMHTVSSLWLVPAGARPAFAPGEYVVVLDAMRGEWFAAPVLVDEQGRAGPPSPWTLTATAALEARAAAGARVVGPAPFGGHLPHARGVGQWYGAGLALGDPVSLDGWEPDYGRKAQAQVTWEAAHGRPLGP
jgi:tRNA threonylcarbamoyladenosine biosynthesis protein TsaB